ncbi:MAG: hypothetical protein ACIARQ_14525 [Phycisphaerales bacterium JB061]
MQNPKIRLVLAASATFMAPAALAQGVYAEFYSPANPGDGWAALPGFPNQDANEPGLASGSDVLIEITNSATVRVFTDDPANTDIGVVTLKTNPDHTPTLIIGKPTLPATSEDNPISPVACRTLAGVTANERTRLQVRARNISGPGIDVHQLIRLDLAGDLDAPVVHWGDMPGSAPKLGAVSITGSVTPNGSIAAYRGHIGPVSITGDLNGNLASLRHSIESITVEGSIGAQGRPSIYATAPLHSFAIEHINVEGSIGTPTSLVGIITAGAVRTIEADEIHANIDLETDPSIPGYIAGLTTREGDFSGSFRARTLTSFARNSESPCAIKIAGDLDGEMVFTNGMRNEYAAGPEVDIGGTLTENALFFTGIIARNDSSIPAGEIIIRSDQALEGQIIIGKGNETDFNEPAKVTVGTTSPMVITNSTKHYTTPFADFGGGAIGVAPFNFHQTESFPNHNETVTLDSDQLLTAVAPRFFGPVFATDASLHMIVEHLAEGSQTWVDRSSEFITEAPTEDDAGSRTIVVRAVAPSSFDAGQWRLRPVEGALKSAKTIANPDVKFVSEYSDNTYRFNVVGGSDCDAPGGRSQTSDNEIDFEDADGVIDDVICP